ncbi:MAG: kinetochore-associated Ndc80 complex subunit ndc80 [Thelocarpon impressellum]|nr:MAG: kinetochore-associated Ndc80 complex subunit ndc80 [Thelocarpon impressellum]
MSQDTGLFSVRRPRETLGGMNFNSGIPQPASALKRSNSISNMSQNGPYTASHARSVSGSRASLAPPRPSQPMFHRSSSGGNLAELGASTVKRNSQVFASGRKSQVPSASVSGEQSAQRRSSVYRRPTSIGHQSFFQQGPLPAGVPRDPRPLKDRSYQARIGQELLDYLTHHGFEMEMRHSLTQMTMKSPTQKDFNYIFQWLYHRIDPAYKFVKNIDQEVPPILRQLRYPFERSITKSQIAAVGGQNWSTFLGLLHWMMQLAVMLERYDAGEYEEACAEAGVDVSSDRIVFGFLSKAYRDWLQVEDDNDDDDDADKVLAPHVAEMARQFARANERYLQEMRVLEAEHASLRDQVQELERGAPNVAKLDKIHGILEDDKRKFEEYINIMGPKADKYEARVKLLADEVERAETEQAEAERERKELQAAVHAQGVTVQDIDRMNGERERLQKGVETTAARLDEAKRRVAEREAEAGTRLDELERAVERHNGLCYHIGLIPSSAPNAGGKEYELVVRTTDSDTLDGSGPSTRLLADGSNTGYQPHQLLNLDARNTLKAAYLALRKDINERRGQALLADEKNRELLDAIGEALEDKRAEVETLSHRVRAAEDEHERTRDVTGTQKLASDAQIERMEKELAKMRAGLSESVQVMEQREMNTNLEYEQLTHRAAALREELHTEIERALNDVIRFKVHVQERIEDFDGFVVAEVEAELGNGDVLGDEDGLGAEEGDGPDGALE